MDRDLASVIEALYSLHVGLTGRGAEQHERPHKPLLLLSVLDAVAVGETAADRVRWSQELRARFRSYLDVVSARDDRPTPQNPFFHLRSDGFWHPEVIGPGGSPVPLGQPPTVAQAKQGLVVARLDPDVARCIASRTGREALREALVARYFPEHAEALASLYEDLSLAAESPAPGYRPTGEARQRGTPGQARQRAFRAKVVEQYDSQCAACGLRIRIQDLVAVEAAHLVPFVETHNDHPSNGLALCRNHHWAMDQHLIAPAPGGVWRASRALDPRRSRAEQSLVELDGRPVLRTRDAAYLPRADGLRWREERLR